ncbi:MAG: aminotransferase class IV [Acidobacteria bacterium]|nr:aminotransferase class IV [Acidobacteriota bacterium]
MEAAVNVNGQLFDARSAVISVFDHGFLYGEGIYETLRTYNREPFLFDRHMRRLRNSAARIELRVPLSDAQFMTRIRDTMEAAGFQEETYTRILLTRGVGELTYDPAACPNASVVVIVKRHVAPSTDAFERGVMISLVSVMRNHPGSVDPIIKSNNLLNNALAMQEAFRNGGDEALMRNYRGELSECSQSNVFIVKNGAVLTPRLDAGLLDGITRDFVLEISCEVGIPTAEAILHDEDLFGADEAFITSTTREVMPVVRVDAHSIGTGRPGLVTLKLLDTYRRKADELTRRAAQRV